MSKGTIAGITVACGFLPIALISVAIFALLQKKRKELSGRANPFGKAPNNMNCNSNYVAVNASGET